jgi:hypothetical protein
VERARAFGLHTATVDGRDVAAVHEVATDVIERARGGGGPSFVLATCPRLDGHFLGDPMIRMAREPISEGRETFGKVMASAVSRGGGSLRERAGGMGRMMRVLASARRGASRGGMNDPLTVARGALAERGVNWSGIDAEAEAEIAAAAAAALAGTPEGGDA